MMDMTQEQQEHLRSVLQKWSNDTLIAEYTNIWKLTQTDELNESCLISLALEVLETLRDECVARVCALVTIDEKAE